MYTYVSALILSLLIGYLIGSIPFGVVLAKLFRLPDPRTIGSGNIGATNMLRTGNKKVALLTLLLDAGKGAISFYTAKALFAIIPFVELATTYGAAPFQLGVLIVTFGILGAVLGHCYSPWLKFTGGKGVATCLGGWFALDAFLGVLFCFFWLIVFLITRFVSFASIMALFAAPSILLIIHAFAVNRGTAEFGLATAALAVLTLAPAVCIYKHRSNMKRLLSGEEPKMYLRKKRDA